MITAKAFVSSRTVSGEGDQEQVSVRLGADYNDGRNKEWALYTPSLDLQMTLKGAVAEKFQQGAHVTILFDIDEPEPAPVDPAQGELPASV